MLTNPIVQMNGFSLPTQPEKGAGDMMLAAAEEFISTLRAGEAEGVKALVGQGDPHQLVTALAESKLAIEATVAVRDRAVEAYQELLRMPV